MIAISDWSSSLHRILVLIRSLSSEPTTMQCETATLTPMHRTRPQSLLPFWMRYTRWYFVAQASPPSYYIIVAYVMGKLGFIRFFLWCLLNEKRNSWQDRTWQDMSGTHDDNADLSGFTISTQCKMQTLMDEEKRVDYDSLIGFSRLAINPFLDATFEKDQVRTVQGIIIYNRSEWKAYLNFALIRLESIARAGPSLSEFVCL